MKSKILAALLMLIPAVAGAQTLTLSKSTYAPSDSITVTFSGAPGNSHDYIGIYPSNAANPQPSWPGATIDWFYTAGSKNAPTTVGPTSGSLTFTALPVGNYDMRFFPNDSMTSTVHVFFSVQVPVSGAHLVWDVAAASLSDVNSTVWTLQIDNFAATSITPACSGSASPFKCSLPYPTVAPGVHLFTIVGGGTSQSLLVAPLAPAIVVQ